MASTWWTEHFPRARLWPVPSGKDPGDGNDDGVQDGFIQGQAAAVAVLRVKQPVEEAGQPIGGVQSLRQVVIPGDQDDHAQDDSHQDQ